MFLFLFQDSFLFDDKEIADEQDEETAKHLLI